MIRLKGNFDIQNWSSEAKKMAKYEFSSFMSKIRTFVIRNFLKTSSFELIYSVKKGPIFVSSTLLHFNEILNFRLIESLFMLAQIKI